jgi:hypothetical protein
MKKDIVNLDITPKLGEKATDSALMEGLGRLPDGWNDNNETTPYQSSTPVPKSVKDGKLNNR